MVLAAEQSVEAKATTAKERSVEETAAKAEENELALEEEAEAKVLAEVLFEVALIEAALANASSSQAIDSAKFRGGNSTTTSTTFLSSTAAPYLPPHSNPIDTAVEQPVAAFFSNEQPPTPKWTPDPIEQPVHDTMVWRHGWLVGHDTDFAADDPPMALLPMAAACVLLLLLSSWGQLRRSRRRVLERQDDAWRSDLDLLESAYSDQTESTAALPLQPTHPTLRYATLTLRLPSASDDDGFGDLQSEDEEEYTLQAQEMAALARKMKLDVGVRETIEFGRETSLQEGFGVGFNMATRDAFGFSVLRGALCVAVASGLSRSLEERESRQLHGYIEELRVRSLRVPAVAVTTTETIVVGPVASTTTAISNNYLTVDEASDAALMERARA